MLLDLCSMRTLVVAAPCSGRVDALSTVGHLDRDLNLLADQTLRALLRPMRHALPDTQQEAPRAKMS